MKRKGLLAVITILCALACSVFLVACGNGNTPNGGGHKHSYVWVDNGDGTHKQHCSVDGCSAPDINIGYHVWDDNYNCICGAKLQPTEGLEYTEYDDHYEVSGIGTATDTDIVIPSEHNGKPVTSIEEEAFYGCKGLTSITIPNSVTSIGYSAFSGCKGLTSITIGNSVKSIGEDTFRDCTGLTSVTIGNSVKSIGDSAFYNCTGLTSITIPDSVTRIEYNAFRGCSGLTSITIPNSVTSIGGHAFEGCTGLTSITIGNNVTSIGYSAFEGCTGLTSITIPDSVTSIGDSAFRGCTGLKSINYNGTKAQWNAVSKDSSWNNNTGNFTVICSDGKLDKNGNVVS